VGIASSSANKGQCDYDYNNEQNSSSSSKIHTIDNKEKVYFDGHPSHCDPAHAQHPLDDNMGVCGDVFPVALSHVPSVTVGLLYYRWPSYRLGDP
jgi:hypothetical protein